MWRTAKKIAARIREVTGKERVGIIVKGIEVPHFHVHLIPFDTGESLGSGEGGEVAPAEELAAIAEKLRFND